MKTEKFKKSSDAEREDQLKMSFTAGEAHKLEEEKSSPMQEKENKENKEVKGESEEEKEHRLWEEAEAKRRAAVAKQIRERAEASARRREEEDKLWEEAVAKRKAEKEKRILEAAASGYPGAQENRLIEEAEAKKRALKEKKSRAAAEAKRRAENKKRIRQEEADRRAEQEKIRTKVEKARRYAEEQNKMQHSADAWEEAEETQTGTNTILKKRVLGGSLIALIVIAVIWAFSLFNSSAEKPSTPLPTVNAIDEKESDVPVKTNIDSLNRVASFSKLAVGDMHNGGIIFSVDQTSKTGKLAHLDDAGPMTWINAMQIHEELGEGWRLPTFDELETMYQTIGQGASNKGEFSNGLYWSATDFDEYQARLIRFRNGNTSYRYNKEAPNRTFLVRAIRDFSQ